MLDSSDADDWHGEHGVFGSKIKLFSSLADEGVAGKNDAIAGLTDE